MKSALAVLLFLCGCFSPPPVNKAIPHWVISGDEHYRRAIYYDVTGREWSRADFDEDQWHLHFGCGVKRYIGETPIYEEPGELYYETLDDAERAAEAVCAADERFYQ